MDFAHWKEWMKERVLSSPQGAEFIESKTKLEFHEKESFFHTVHMIEKQYHRARKTFETSRTRTEKILFKRNS